MQETVLTLKKLEPNVVPFSANAQRQEQPASLTLPDLAVRRILLPFDFSRASVALLRGTVALAARTGASVQVLHVVDPGALAEQDDHLAAMSEEMLKAWVERIVEGRAKVYVSVRIGHAVEEIIARGKATRADLIVMSANSFSGPRSASVRCVAERVSRDALCAVLTVPEKCAESFADGFDGFPATNWKRILVPIDFSEAASRAIRHAAAIAIENRARLLLVHAAVEKDSMHTGVDAAELATAQTLERLGKWAENEVQCPVDFETTVWIGNCTFYRILSEAARAQADLIVLPTRSSSWARRFRSDSITDGVLRHAACPVLSIHKNIKEIER